MILYYKDAILAGIGPSEFANLTPEQITPETRSNVEEMNYYLKKGSEFHEKVKKDNMLYGRFEYSSQTMNMTFKLGIKFKNFDNLKLNKIPNVNATQTLVDYI